VSDEKIDIDQMIINEWRELGFCYDLEVKNESKEWRFYGTKNGLMKFVDILDKYVANPVNETLSEHDHYGPYGYLKIMTWDKPIITENYIAGSLNDLNYLKNLLNKMLSEVAIGESFDIAKFYGSDNGVAAKFFVMPDPFDPVIMDKSEPIVNKYLQQKGI